MEKIRNTKTMETFIGTIPTVTDKMNEVGKMMEEYIADLQEKQFIEKENETIGNKCTRLESSLDQLDNVIKRREIVTKESKEMIEMMQNMIKEVESITKEGDEMKETTKKIHNELIDQIIEARRNEMIEKIKPLKEDIRKIKEEFAKRKEQFDEKRKEYGETEEEKAARLEKEYEIEKKLFDEKCEKKRKMYEERYDKLEEEFPNYFIDETTNLSKKETVQLNQWTGKKCSNVIFDSNKDDWSSNNTFKQRCFNKSQLVFLVEDNDGNKFGGYLSAYIDKKQTGSWSWGANIRDPNAFVFSLRSNGRITQGNGMMKFEIKNTNYGYYGYDNSSGCLICLGGSWDIGLYKENMKSSSWTNQNDSYFDYHGIENVLTGKYHFTPKRIIVIQMI